MAALLTIVLVTMSRESLPGPIVHPYSFEVLSNSRYSVHSGFTDSLPRQVLANVLWAMNRTPRLGVNRTFYVATRQGVYTYEPAGNVLVLHRAGDLRYSSSAAFEVGVACDRHEEAGMAVQAGLLAGVAFADSAGPGVASCPMKWAADYANANWAPSKPILMVNLYGRAEVRGLDTTRIAACSDSSLSRPRTSGPDTFELVLMGLGQDSVFSSLPLSAEVLSQLLWSGYGPTPHTVYNGRIGLTVPSPAASYHLTGRIYLVRDEGVDRYHNRLPSGSTSTADHRLERILASDRRPELRQACPRIPSTGQAYIVVCVGDTGSYGPMQEAGFTAFQYLAQARALGLAGFVTAPLTRAERQDIALALGLPPGDHPAIVFAVGEPATGITEPKDSCIVEVIRARPVLEPDEELTVEYLLRQPGTVRIDVYDMLGRSVCILLDARQPAGVHRITWNGRDENGHRVKIGSYVVNIQSQGSTSQHKVAVF